MDIFIGKKKNLIIYCLISCLIIITLYYFDYHRNKPLIFWTFFMLFIFLIFRTIQLLTNKNLFFVSKENLTDNSSRNQELKKYDMNSLGIFEYTENGMFITDKNSKIDIKWSDISTILGYKKDLLTIDTICVDIIYNKSSLTVCEETPGWFQFVTKLKKQFPNIPSDWDTEIALPAFERKLTLLYDRQNRKLEQILY